MPIDEKRFNLAMEAIDSIFPPETDISIAVLKALCEAYESAKASEQPVDCIYPALRAASKSAEKNLTALRSVTIDNPQPVYHSQDEVERVARAICREWHSTNVEKQHTDWCVEKFWEKCIPEANAAIAALVTERESGDLRPMFDVMQAAVDKISAARPRETFCGSWWIEVFWNAVHDWRRGSDA